MVVAEHEEVLPVELREAWFTVLKTAHRGKPRPGPYYARRASWICHDFILQSEGDALLLSDFVQWCPATAIAILKCTNGCIAGTTNGSCTACPLRRHTASVQLPMSPPRPSCKLGLMLRQRCICCASQEHRAARYVQALHSHTTLRHMVD